MKEKLIRWTGMILLIFFVAGEVSGQAGGDLTGSWVMQSGEVTLNLSLAQSGNQLTGNLTSTTGVNYSLTGQVESGVAAGTCSDNSGTVYFQVQTEGNSLTLSLVGMDAYNIPDYTTAQYLAFTRSVAAPQQNQAKSMVGALGVTGSGASQATGSASTGSSSIGDNEIGDPSWGFKFRAPEGWVHRQTAEAVLMGHNSIAGMIIILPHMSENMQQLQQEMMKGIQEEGSSLLPAGSLQNAGQNMLTGDYSGIMDGTTVKARGYGLLSPYGGGAYIIAVSTPEKLSQELVAAAGEVSRNMQYFKVEAGDLVQHFAGNWSTFTTNTTTYICFRPDGSYSNQYESSYSGNFTDAGGYNTGNWGTAGSDNSQGRWTVRGSKDAGTITVRLTGGKVLEYNYRVHEEKGQKFYREYWFNGSLYSKSK